MGLQLCDCSKTMFSERQGSKKNPFLTRLCKGSAPEQQPVLPTIEVKVEKEDSSEDRNNIQVFSIQSNFVNIQDADPKQRIEG